MIEYPKIDTLWKRDERFKVIPGEFSRPEFAEVRRWLVTEKVDGTNIRLVFDVETSNYTIHGRTDNASLHPALREHLVTVCEQIKYKVGGIAAKHGVLTLTIYGEGYGAKIQGGGNLSKEPAFVVFDMRVDDSIFLGWRDTCDNAAFLGLKVVPEIADVSYEWLDTMDSEVRNGLLSNLAEVPGTLCEGVVLRPLVPLFDTRGKRVMAKLKTKDYDRG